MRVKAKGQGLVRFKGPTKFKTGTWYGVQLDAPNGKNNGTVGMTSYFRTKPKHGVFVQRHRLAKIDDRPGYGHLTPASNRSTPGRYSPSGAPSGYARLPARRPFCVPYPPGAPHSWLPTVTAAATAEARRLLPPPPFAPHPPCGLTTACPGPPSSTDSSTARPAAGARPNHVVAQKSLCHCDAAPRDLCCDAATLVWGR